MKVPAHEASRIKQAYKKILADQLANWSVMGYANKIQKGKK